MKPSPKLDACLSEIEEIANRLKSAVIGKDSELDRLLRLSEISKASTLASSVLKSANEKTECGKTLNQDTKELVRVLTIKSILTVIIKNKKQT